MHYDYASPQSYLENNVLRTYNDAGVSMLEVSRRYGRRRLWHHTMQCRLWYTFKVPKYPPSGKGIACSLRPGIWLISCSATRMFESGPNISNSDSLCINYQTHSEEARARLDLAHQLGSQHRLNAGVRKLRTRIPQYQALRMFSRSVAVNLPRPGHLQNTCSSFFPARHLVSVIFQRYPNAMVYRRITLT